jgi:hypothetical protein
MSVRVLVVTPSRGPRAPRRTLSVAGKKTSASFCGQAVFAKEGGKKEKKSPSITRCWCSRIHFPGFVERAAELGQRRPWGEQAGCLPLHHTPPSLRDIHGPLRVVSDISARLRKGQASKTSWVAPRRPVRDGGLLQIRTAQMVARRGRQRCDGQPTIQVRPGRIATCRSCASSDLGI